MPALTPAQLRAINTFVDTGIMGGRRSVVPQWDSVAAKRTQGNALGTYAWMNDIPLIAQRQIGGYQKAGVSSQSFQITSKLQGLVLEISARDVRDDLIGVYQDLPGKLGQRMEQFPQDSLFNLFKEGDQTTYLGESILAYDGLAFFHDSHLTDGRSSAGGTYDNFLASTALTKANFEVACASLALFPDNRGVAMNQRPTHLIVPPQLGITGADILLAQTISTGGSNTSNAEYLAARGLPPIQLVVCPELSGDSTTWYLTCMGQGRAPMIWQETAPLMVIAQTSPDSPNMLNDDMLLWYAKGESGFAFGDPRCAIRCVA